MSNLTNSLVLKYGLSSTPTDAQIDRWFTYTNELIAKGNDPEESGRAAAKVTFPDCGSYIRKSQADSILTLLEQVRRK